MTKRIGNFIIIEDDDGQTGQCDSCGRIDDLRPYGLDFALICYECGQKQ